MPASGTPTTCQKARRNCFWTSKASRLARSAADAARFCFFAEEKRSEEAEADPESKVPPPLRSSSEEGSSSDASSSEESEASGRGGTNRGRSPCSRHASTSSLATPSQRGETVPSVLAGTRVG